MASATFDKVLDEAQRLTPDERQQLLEALVQQSHDSLDTQQFIEVDVPRTTLLTEEDRRAAEEWLARWDALAVRIGAAWKDPSRKCGGGSAGAATGVVIVVDASVMVSALWPQDVNHVTSRNWLAAQTLSDEALVAPFLFLGEIAGAITRRTGESELGHAALEELQAIPRLKLVPILVGFRSYVARRLA